MISSKWTLTGNLEDGNRIAQAVGEKMLSVHERMDRAVEDNRGRVPGPLNKAFQHDLEERDAYQRIFTELTGKPLELPEWPTAQRRSHTAAVPGR